MSATVNTGFCEFLSIKLNVDKHLIMTDNTLQCNLKLRILAQVFFKEMVNKVLHTGDQSTCTS